MKRKAPRELWSTYGIPSLVYSLGIGIMFTGPGQFWLGVMLSALSVLYVGLALAYSGINQSIRDNIASGFLTLAAIGIPAWFVFQPAPLSIVLNTGPGNYPVGSKIGGVSWPSDVTEVDAGVANTSEDDYSNFEMRIGTNLSFMQLGILQRSNTCAARPLSPPPILLQGTGEKGQNISQFVEPVEGAGYITPIVVIRCEKLLSHTEFQAIGALVTVNPIVNGAWPSSLLGPRYAPRWVRVEGHFTSGGRLISFSRDKCFTDQCPDVPKTLGKQAE